MLLVRQSDVPIFPLVESLTPHVERHPESEAIVFREFIIDSWEVLYGVIVEWYKVRLRIDLSQRKKIRGVQESGRRCGGHEMAVPRVGRSGKNGQELPFVDGEIRSKK